MNMDPTIPLSDLVETALKLRDDRVKLYSQLEDNGKLLIEALREIYERTHGVKVGSIVEQDGKTFKVKDVIVRIDGEPNGKPWVAGYKRNASSRAGEFSTRVWNLFSNWTLIEK